MFNVGFLSSGVTRVCLNAVGKMPVRRDVLIMCVSAGKFGYFRLSEGTEGEDGSLSSGSSWLGVLCEWRRKLTTDCFSFVCKKKLQSHQLL